MGDSEMPIRALAARRDPLEVEHDQLGRSRSHRRRQMTASTAGSAEAQRARGRSSACRRDDRRSGPPVRGVDSRGLLERRREARAHELTIVGRRGGRDMGTSPWVEPVAGPAWPITPPRRSPRAQGAPPARTVEFAVEHALDVARLDVRAVVLDHRVRVQDVAADLPAPATSWPRLPLSRAPPGASAPSARPASPAASSSPCRSSTTESARSEHVDDAARRWAMRTPSRSCSPCWPPAPEAFYVTIWMSPLGISTSIESSTSWGTVSTGEGVLRRDCESNGEIRNEPRRLRRVESVGVLSLADERGRLDAGLLTPLADQLPHVPPASPSRTGTCAGASPPSPASQSQKGAGVDGHDGVAGAVLNAEQVRPPRAARAA